MGILWSRWEEITSMRDMYTLDKIAWYITQDKYKNFYFFYLY